MDDNSMDILNVINCVNYGDFPGGPEVKNPPSNAGDPGSIPGWKTNIPHAVGATKPECCS